ncbi:hypothetical protein [Citromicrobium bathyomarinum]|uniref:hypothetical protein n=1 Tax=Citromicrobium bathyomarinum TaxID=72174 RepID=UPI003159E06E
MKARTIILSLAYAALAAGMALAIPGFARAETSGQAGGGSNTASDVAAHNAGYERGLAFGTSAQTVGEMLQCSAVWDRWSYVLASAADPAFAAGLRGELSAENAASRKAYWRRMARREMQEDDDASYFERRRADAEESADEIYADYANGAEKGLQRMMEWLALC